MAGHKCVQFQTDGVKKSKGYHKFREPEGMTNVDLKNDGSNTKKVDTGSPTRSLRKLVVKSLVVTGFLLLGTIILLAILPQSEINAFNKVESSTLNNLATNTNKSYISNSIDEFNNCVAYKSLEECCLIFGYLDNDKITENCIIGDEFSWNKTRTNFSTSREKKDNVNDNDLIFGDDKSKESLSSVLSPLMKSDMENDIFGFEIKIEKMSNPIIKTNDVFFDIDNTSIHIEKKHSPTPKRSYMNTQNMPTNLYNDILLRNARYAEDAKTIEAKSNHYTNSFPEHQTVKGEDLIFSNLNLYNDYGHTFSNNPFQNDLYQINNYEITDPKKRNNEYNTYSNNPIEEETILPNTKKQDHNLKSEEVRINDSNDPANKSKQTQLDTRLDFLQLSQRNSLNSPYYQHQCIPYTPQVGASLPMFQQSQLPPYPYDPNIKLNSILPIPQIPSGTYPQYPYINPNYSPQLPSAYPMYPYNPYYVNQNMQNPMGQYYLCSPIPALSGGASHIANIPGIEVRANSIIDEPDEQLNNKIRISSKCPIGEITCEHSNKCIRQNQICDSQVDCADASDEMPCTCANRVTEDRLCDGYLDCPNGEDEVGCFGCDSSSFSCDILPDENKATNCVNKDQRCDGTIQCSNGRDEEDCTILFEFSEKPLSLHQVSKAKGFLYRNYKGSWYPTCSAPLEWAAEVCNKETGESDFPPVSYMESIRLSYRGSYLNNLPDGTIELVDSCFNGYAVFVECHPPNCGVRNLLKTSTSNTEELDESMEDAISRFRHTRSNNDSDFVELSRVVGGNPSEPAAWPWVVSIYRNGLFHCGGVIVTESWVITAAHCVDRYTHYYYEVEAGILRRFSHSPMQQTRFVAYIIAHNAYDRANLKNDLAMMKLSEPLTYSRYVRPICLPSEFISGKDYLKEPTPGTICTAVGWGATVEHGTDPDHLREVEIPVLNHCKHSKDEDGQEICAGYLEGGKDACQGDSGGPFMCKNSNSPDQWYLAGIVSHGEGCARPNEPGVYTRVSLYLSWLHRHLHHHHLPRRKPLQECPGYSCKSSNKCLPKKRRCDRVIDCVLADDEIHCEKNIVEVFRNAMRHMVLAGTTRKETEDEDTTPTKLETEVTTMAATEASTLITNENSVATGVVDNIFDTTFKMENSPTPDDLNRNEFGYAAEDTSFASPPEISDEAQSISYGETTQASVNIYSVTGTLKDLSYRDGTESLTKINDTISISLSTPSIEQNATNPAAILTDHFKCTRMLQVIDSSERCDKVADCEDISDEENCNCADYLLSFHPEAICDGSIDCYDISDESNCGTPCQQKEYHCSLSEICVPLNKKCDNIPDCPQNEDEKDCFALTDGSTIHLDADLRPRFNTMGMIAFYYQESWWPMCGENWTNFQYAVASEMCISLGLSDYERSSQVQLKNRPLKIEIDRETSWHNTQNNEDARLCNALYVKCSNVSVVRWHDEGTNRGNIAPWDVAIFVNGLYKCTGTLVNINWALTSSNCFRGINELDSHYVTVLLGVGGGYLDIVGPHEQIRLVAESMPVLYSDVYLLRFEKGIVYTRYVRPLHFTQWNEIHRFKEQCYTVGRSSNNRLISVELIRVANCTPGSKCFKRSQAISVECQEAEKSWSGTIVCETGNGFYPSAVFFDKNGFCGFRRTSAFTTLSLFVKNIFDIFETRRTKDFTIYPKECKGFRCELGKCIESPRICDGIPDCRSGEDEDKTMCRERSILCHLSNSCDCAKNQLTCNNGKCISKSAFCNKIDDCGDGSDEPDECSCFEYLKMTNPEKICDGIRNCHDRSDENPKICKCEIGKFMCAHSKFCVPMEMVCDGYSDCPNHEDEDDCMKLRALSSNSHAGEVITRTAGVWHRGCFGQNETQDDVENICHHLGLTNINATRLRFPFETDEVARKPILNPFNVVWLNRNSNVTFKLAIRTGNTPFVSFINSTDCYRLFIKCV